MMSDLELLAAMKEAYRNLIMGQSVSSVSKDGRTVQYTAANIAQLKIEISSLERQLGINNRLSPAGLI